MHNRRELNFCIARKKNRFNKYDKHELARILYLLCVVYDSTIKKKKFSTLFRINSIKTDEENEVRKGEREKKKKIFCSHKNL